MLRTLALGLLLLSFITLAACTQSSTSGTTGAVIGAGTSTAGNLKVTLLNAKGRLSEGDNEFTVEFKNSSGQAIDVGAITLAFDMAGMGSMPPMHNNAQLTTTQTPGIYQAHAKIEMNGTWQVNIAYKGPAGEGKASFPIQAK